MSNERHRLVVGGMFPFRFGSRYSSRWIKVDFGTTYSGLAYIHTTEPDYKNIEVIDSWPGRGNTNHAKVPTEISYSDKGATWGYDIPRTGSTTVSSAFPTVQSVRLRGRTGRTTARSPSFSGC
ncbi:hypothetical protein B9Z19DRAFT_1122899 [Tuber borchii]|uniref:Uncharacterized protein n=1 Tax=Tuber borchii TaxID=42251 RepID=A0A2T6ZZE4_TUBBO|nr:hypothetical protein B9Z19DRAFT_1122899 [Tuber borchii]